MTSAPAGPALRPEDLQPRGRLDRVLVGVFVTVPLLAVLAALPMAWTAGLLGWSDALIGLVMYLVAGLGVTVGFHRYFTHGSFKARCPLKIALAMAGSLSIEMSVVDWVATHRRHHRYSDQAGDPHSPWRYGTDRKAVARGLLYSHVGWLFDTRTTNRERYATPSRPAPGTARCPAARPERAGDPLVRAARLGLRRALADRAAPGRQTRLIHS